MLEANKLCHLNRLESRVDDAVPNKKHVVRDGTSVIAVAASQRNSLI